MRVRGQRLATLVNAPRLQFSLGGLLFIHLNQLELRFSGNYYDLRKGFVWSEDVGPTFRRGLEESEVHHRPPVSQKSWHRYRDGLGRVGVEPRMGLYSDGQSFLYLQVEKYLIGVEEVTEISEGRPLQSGFWVGAEVALKNEMTISRGDVKFVVEGIKYLDAIARTLGKRDAVPSILVRAILTRFALPRPARDLTTRASWARPWPRTHPRRG